MTFLTLIEPGRAQIDLAARRTQGYARCAVALWLALAVCVLSGCASFETEPPEEAVARRALEWTDALMALDYELALTYATSTYQSSPRSERFAADYSGASWWQGVDVVRVECDDVPNPEKCESRLSIKLLRPPATSWPIPITYDLVWLRSGSEWYVIP